MFSFLSSNSDGEYSNNDDGEGVVDDGESVGGWTYLISTIVNFSKYSIKFSIKEKIYFRCLEIF